MTQYPMYKSGNVPLDAKELKGNVGNIDFSYDAGADVLYIAMWEPSPAVCDEVLPGVLVRRGLLNHVVGITLVGLEVIDLNEAVHALREIPDMPYDLIAFIDSHAGQMQTKMFGERNVTG